MSNVCKENILSKPAREMTLREMLEVLFKAYSIVNILRFRYGKHTSEVFLEESAEDTECSKNTDLFSTARLALIDVIDLVLTELLKELDRGGEQTDE